MQGTRPTQWVTACRGTGPEADQGAYAIVLAGGYADDEDEGTSFWYTGEGGQEAKGRQVCDRMCWRGRGLPGGHRSIPGDWKRWRRGGCPEAGEMQGWTRIGLLRGLLLNQSPHTGERPGLLRGQSRPQAEP